MIRSSTIRKYAFSKLGLSLTVAGALLMIGLVPGSNVQVISSAQAWIGRPLTPMSFAGVARRTTRRHIYYGGAAMAGAAVAGAAVAGAAMASTPVVVNSTVINQSAPVTSSVVASPPANCSPEGAVFVCGGYAYQPMMQGSTVVYTVHPAN